MRVAQIWFIDRLGNERPVSTKLYSKIGTAKHWVKKWNAEPMTYVYFVKVYELTELETIKE